MKIFKNTAIFFWRMWFYGWMIGTIIAILPVLAIVISKEKWYPIFFKIARAWGKTLLFVMGFRVKIDQEQEISPNKSYMFSANHTSMMDIMLMFAVAKNPFVFVGKAELAKIPIFGFVYKRTCILVDRSNPESRKAVFSEAQRRIKNGLSVCIFPEGQVPSDESVVLDEFKNGAFILAIEHQIPIVPMTFYDCKKRFSYTFFSGSPGKLRVKIHKFIETKGLEIKDKNTVKKQMFDLIYNDLKSDLENK
ncbi:MAG: 1-acyl-sn-glycerol-3-phosphate acyltransferase [Flavobacteriaceae bacterium]|nr:1-acyl-sn-glycerol-3-phosphate acyltransferase [Flavobacteriaceae bacterium]